MEKKKTRSPAVDRNNTRDCNLSYYFVSFFFVVFYLSVLFAYFFLCSYFILLGIITHIDTHLTDLFCSFLCDCASIANNNYNESENDKKKEN